jgi:hypothetical protein
MWHHFSHVSRQSNPAIKKIQKQKARKKISAATKKLSKENSRRPLSLVCKGKSNSVVKTGKRIKENTHTHSLTGGRARGRAREVSVLNVNQSAESKSWAKARTERIMFA